MICYITTCLRNNNLTVFDQTRACGQGHWIQYVILRSGNIKYVISSMLVWIVRLVDMLYYHMSSQQQSHGFRPNPCLWSMNHVWYCMFSQWHVIKHETESRRTGSITKIDFTGWLDRPTVATSNLRSTHYPYDLALGLFVAYIYIYIYK